jgi:hypothetical protein
MCRQLYVSLSMAVLLVAIPLRAANRPQAGAEGQNSVWTNDDLEKLHAPGLISIVGRGNDETSKSASLPQPRVKTQDAAWYAEQASKLRDELERRRAQLSEYREAIEDARNLREMTGGINLDAGDIGITPQASIEILHHRIREEQARLEALEDLARRHDIPPGTLRAQ